MHAFLALALALAAPALAAAAAVSRDRLGYEREIDASRYVLSNEFLSSQKSKDRLVTKLRADEAVVEDNVILESNAVRILRPQKHGAESQRAAGGDELVRRRRGYNLENVRVPARYPYLPVANFNRFRRWG